MTGIHPTSPGRRAFLRDGSLVLAAAGADLLSPAGLFSGEAPATDGLRVGLITDLHYADKPPAGTRHYRETLGKLAEAARQFEKDKPAFVVELGDLIDAADSVEVEQAYLKRVDKEFAAVAKDRHYVLGNHCVDTLTKDEFLAGVGQKRSYYSFDAGGIHFIVLDACFRSDGKPYGRKNSKWTDANIPAHEVEWLRADLAGTPRRTVVFAHQRLDVGGPHGVKNAPEVRGILEGSGKVLAVFQGHSHKNDYKDIAGVHYCTLVAMVEGTGAENSGYSTVDIRADGTVTVTGFRKQKGYDWKRPPK
jgi:alkaline phosphatase